MIGIGIIGTGGISHAHADGYIQLPDRAEILAVADIDYDRAKSVANQWGVKHAFSDYQEMLKLDQIDAISVCTYTKAHAQPSIDALNAGKHVLVEKPMAATAAEGIQMAKASRKRGQEKQ